MKPRAHQISAAVSFGLLGLGWWIWGRTPSPPTPAQPLGIVTREVTPAERRAGIGCVQGQLDAFRAADWKGAISFQSTALRAGFPTADAFREMMEGMYPRFLDFRRVEYGACRSSEAGDTLEVMIVLTGPDGHRMEAVYTLVREAGSYKVAGVAGGFVVPPPGAEPPPPPGAEPPLPTDPGARPSAGNRSPPAGAGAVAP